MKYICTVLLIFISFYSFSKCTINDDSLDEYDQFIVKYDYFLDAIKSVSSFNTIDNIAGKAHFEKITPNSFMLKYQYDNGTLGFFLFIVDTHYQKIYLTQYLENTDVKKALISGRFREGECVLDFIISENQKVSINFHGKLNLTSYYRSTETEELKVISQYNFKK